MKKLTQYLFSKGYLDWLPDQPYLKLRYEAVTGKKLNLKNPISYNEKIQWLKLYDRNMNYVKMVDKYEVKEYVASIIGNEHIIPLLGLWDNVDDIDFTSLPDQFVLKCTHDSGGVIICTDKSKLDIPQTKAFLKNQLEADFYRTGREWPYKFVKPRIIAEKYMVDESGKELKDYKIFCFSGEPKLIQVDYDRFIQHKRNLYDINWNYIDAEIGYPTDKAHTIKNPQNLDTMLSIAKKLSAGIKHVRIDLYNINNVVYFGEMTFYHGSGIEEFKPEAFGRNMGNWIKLT